MGQIIGQLNAFSAGLDSIRDAIVVGVGADQGDKADAGAQAIEALQENFGQFAKGLEAVKAAVEKGAGELVKQADPAGRLAQIQTVGGEILQKLNDVIAAVKQDGQLQHETAKRHEALTINDNAQTLVAVLEEQFKTMETWLTPVTKSDYARGAYLADLISRFEAMAAGYQHLVGVLQTKHPGAGDSKETPPAVKAQPPVRAKKARKKTAKKPTKKTTKPE